MIEVHFAAPLRPMVGGADLLNVEGKNLGEIINKLGITYPAFKERVFDINGCIKSSIHIFRNADDIRFLNGIETTLENGDVVLILPDAAGG